MDREARDMEKSLQRLPKKTNPSVSGKPSKFSHPVYSKISKVNGRLNRMDVNQLKNECQLLELDARGKVNVVKQRLKEYHRETLLSEAGLIPSDHKRNIDYFVVIDFEATCEVHNPTDFCHEIIEFPAVLVSSDPPEIVDVFHAYCRPEVNPNLTEFCKTLTGIQQDTVDQAESFLRVQEKFMNWLMKHGLGTKNIFAIVTDGPFDMSRFLYQQTKISRVDFPEYAKSWVNLRKTFINFYNNGESLNTNNKKKKNAKGQKLARYPNLETMLTFLGLSFEGQPHSGLDDSKNIARIVVKMLSDKAVLRINEKIALDRECHPENNHFRVTNVDSVSKEEFEKWLEEQRRAQSSKRKLTSLHFNAKV